MASRISWRKALSWRECVLEPGHGVEERVDQPRDPGLALEWVFRRLLATGAVGLMRLEQGAPPSIARERGSRGIATSSPPRVFFGITPDLVAVERERGHRGRAQVFIEDADRGILDHVDGTAHRECAPPACRTPSPPAARGRRCRCGWETRTRRRAGSTKRARSRPWRPRRHGLRKTPLELRSLRPVAHDQLRPGQVETRGTPEGSSRRATRPTKTNTGWRRSLKRVAEGLKSSVSTPRDQSDDVAESLRARTDPVDGGRRHEDRGGRRRGRRSQRIGHAQRHAEPRLHVFGKHVWYAVVNARRLRRHQCARRDARAALGGDVDRVGTRARGMRRGKPCGPGRAPAGSRGRSASASCGSPGATARALSWPHFSSHLMVFLQRSPPRH